MTVTVKDLEDRNYLLLSDSQDRKAVLTLLGIPNEIFEWPHLFVLAENGEYLEVWGCASSVPYLHAPVYKLWGK